LDLTGPSVTKKCKICDQQKDISEFYKNGTWTRPECKECYKQHKSLYYKLRKGQTTPEPGTPCQCCGSTEVSLHWDHDHETKEHRGWICGNCNTGIGKLGDNISGVQKALDYLASMGNLEDADTKGDYDFKEEEGSTTKSSQ